MKLLDDIMIMKIENQIELLRSELHEARFKLRVCDTVCDTFDESQSVLSNIIELNYELSILE